jgi:hypothetical protein
MVDADDILVDDRSVVELLGDVVRGGETPNLRKRRGQERG